MLSDSSRTRGLPGHTGLTRCGCCSISVDRVLFLELSPILFAVVVAEEEFLSGRQVASCEHPDAVDRVAKKDDRIDILILGFHGIVDKAKFVSHPCAINLLLSVESKVLV